MKTTFITLLLLTSATLAQSYPPVSTEADYIDAVAEVERLGSLDGTWQGRLTPLHDPVGSQRNEPDGFEIRIEIAGEEAALWYEEDGRFEPYPGGSILLFADNRAAMIIYVAENESFIETVTFTLSHKTKDEVVAYGSRVVHNVAIRPDSPWRIFPVYSQIDLRRLPASAED